MALGRTKNGRRQEAESFAEQEPAQPDHELESYLAALAPEEDVETTGSGRRFGSSQVYQLRLPLMANEQLKEAAARHGTSPASLARDWVMQHLSHEDSQDPSPAWPQQEAQQERPPAHAQSAQQFGTDQYAVDQQYTGELLAGGLHPAEETDVEITMPRGGQYW